MNIRYCILFSAFLLIISGFSKAACQISPESGKTISVPGDKGALQYLVNGKLWLNLYMNVRGNQFFLSENFFTGDLFFNGRNYTGVPLKYDILNDDLLLGLPYKPVIVLNREYIDSFRLKNNNGVIYRFIKSDSETGTVMSGFVQVLYDGSSSLYIKHQKKILPMAVDNRYDLFEENDRVFVSLGGSFFQMNNKKELLKRMGEKKEAVKVFIRKNKLDIRRSEPSGMIAVLKYFDSLPQM